MIFRLKNHLDSRKKILDPYVKLSPTGRFEPVSFLFFIHFLRFFILAFFFTTFSELEANDLVIEFGWRMNVPSEKAVEAIQWLKMHNIDINLLTGEINLEQYDTQ